MVGLQIGDEAMCAGKKAYPSYWKAARAASRLNKMRGHTKGNPYHCPSCKGYHVGNTLGRVQHRRISRQALRRALNGGI